MAGKKVREKEHVVCHEDVSVWAKGKMVKGVPTGYWEWYRKDGTKPRSGYFLDGEQIGEWTTYDKSEKVFKVTVMKAKKSKEK
jgi:antitoxin component YwqK of YwqJK toxin-antitoxin module